MNNIGETREVYFDIYCKTCKNLDSKESEEPCATCLNNPTNAYSHKPVRWESR